MAALAKFRVADNRLFAVGAAWNAGLDATFDKGLAQLVAVMALVGNHDVGLR